MGHIEPKVSEIPSEAGLSNQMFYRYFSGEHAGLVALLDEGIRGPADYLAARMGEEPDPVSATRAWLRGMAAQALDPSGARASGPFARGRFAEAFPSEVAESERRVTAPLQEALEQARSEPSICLPTSLSTWPNVSYRTEKGPLNFLSVQAGPVS